MTGEATPARWAVVVRRDRPDLYGDLCRKFEGNALIRVILDRREVQRSGEAAPAEASRAGRHRRRPLTAKERDLWETAGFLPVYTGRDLDIYETRGGPPRRKVGSRRRPRPRRTP